jgi:UDP-glucose:(heptosyl)LPS alpha-1,3-glucosyltransferase
LFAFTILRPKRSHRGRGAPCLSPAIAFWFATYYRLLSALENREYQRKGLRLAAVLRRTAAQLSCYFGRNDVVVVPNGVDLANFSPSACSVVRAKAREELSCGPQDRLLLLVGNDLRNKGLPALLQALEQCQDLAWRLCLVGADAASEYSDEIRRRQMQDRITFAGETSDILSCYAAADIYVAPSVEDSFHLPALEAMACGLPVILSSSAGMSEYLEDGVDGMLLRNPKDANELATALRRLLADPELRVQLGKNATQTAARFS